MKSLLEKPRPGQFKAVCRKEEWVPLADVLTLPREQQPDTTVTRWDKKLRLEVCAARCDFTTDDPSAYLAHMSDVHGKKPRGPRQLKQGTGLWNAPKLRPEGKPWVDPSTRKDHSYTQTCGGCGLVAEVDDRPANVLWWAEHERMCVGSAVAS